MYLRPVIACLSRPHLSVHRLSSSSIACFASDADTAYVEKTTAAVDHHVEPLELLRLRDRRLKSGRKDTKGATGVPTSRFPVALELFEATVQRAQQEAKEVLLGNEYTQNLQEWDVAEEIKKLHASDATPQGKLAFFRTHILPHLQDLRGALPRHIFIAINQLLSQLCEAVTRDGIIGMSLDLSRAYVSILAGSLDVQNALILNLCHTLITGQHKPENASSILDELLALWIHISNIPRIHSSNPERQKFVLPTADELFSVSDAKKVRKSKIEPLYRAFASIFAPQRIEQARQLFPGLLASLAVLSDLGRAGQTKAAPLLELTALALREGDPDGNYIDRIFSLSTRYPAVKHSEVHDYTVEKWPRVQAMLGCTSWRSAQDSTVATYDASTSYIDTLHKQLRAARASRNTSAAVLIWAELKDRFAREPSLITQLHARPAFFDYCIFLWCATKRPQILQETLEMMQAIQMPLTITSYTAMMHGWKFVKDAAKINQLWNQLVKSDMKLDAVIWTERISSLIELRMPQAGIRALAEMMALWQQAVREKGPIEAATVAVRPSIEVVNAALQGLLRIDVKAANELLAWAGREGIQPNAYTYNILLRQSFRNGDVESVRGVLRSMRDHGINPDNATFTIMLEEFLSNMRDSSAAEQVQAVQQTLSEIEAAGLRANQETYHKMMHAVASLPDGGADEAIDAIRSHMGNDGNPSPPHTVTILLERALSHNRTLTSKHVRVLLERHGLLRIDQGDQTLWERVTKAYATLGDVQSALTLFRDLAGAGRPVMSLPCLTTLLDALLAADKREEAREVVRVVLTQKAAERKAAGANTAGYERYWDHHLWNVVRENGLLVGADIPAVLQDVFIQR